jgi:hypothetical protein
MQNTPFRRVIALTATLATNLLNPPTLTGGVGITPTKTYILLKHIILVNTTAADIQVSLFLGATGAAAAGTEVGGTVRTVPLRGVLEISFPPSGLPMETADFLTGGGSAVGVTATLLGEIGVRP